MRVVQAVGSSRSCTVAAGGAGGAAGGTEAGTAATDALAAAEATGSTDGSDEVAIVTAGADGAGGSSPREAGTGVAGWQATTASARAPRTPAPLEAANVASTRARSGAVRGAGDDMGEDVAGGRAV